MDSPDSRTCAAGVAFAFAFAFAWCSGLRARNTPAEVSSSLSLDEECEEFELVDGAESESRAFLEPEEEIERERVSTCSSLSSIEADGCESACEAPRRAWRRFSREDILCASRTLRVTLSKIEELMWAVHVKDSDTLIALTAEPVAFGRGVPGVGIEDMKLSR
jgi:hypothetical protein